MSRYFEVTETDGEPNFVYAQNHTHGDTNEVISAYFFCFEVTANYQFGSENDFLSNYQFTKTNFFHQMTNSL